MQSASVSGTDWYDLSSVQTGLVVMYILTFTTLVVSPLISSLVDYLVKGTFPCSSYFNMLGMLKAKKVLFKGWFVTMQESGSLYGALVGSVLAFTIADFLGIF